MIRLNRKNSVNSVYERKGDTSFEIQIIKDEGKLITWHLSASDANKRIKMIGQIISQQHRTDNITVVQQQTSLKQNRQRQSESIFGGLM